MGFDHFANQNMVKIDTYDFSKGQKMLGKNVIYSHDLGYLILGLRILIP